MELADALPEGKLIKYCEEIWQTYNPAATTPDTHVEECLAKWKIQDPKDNKFIQQVFTGMVRYKKLVGVFIQAFYFAKGGEVSRTDVDTYSVFAYLTLLRLQELQYVAFRKLILAQEPQKMLVLLQFIFNEVNLMNFCRDPWMKLYDVQYVDALIQTVLSFLPDLADMITSLEEKVYMAKKAEEKEANSFAAKGSAQVTVPVPFNLKAPEPRKLEPEYVHPSTLQPKARPAPPRKLAGHVTSDEVCIKEQKELNKRTQQAFLDECKPFNISPLTSKLDQVKASVEAKRQAECPFKPEEPVKPAPAPPTAQVKLNAAAILREDALYKKKQDQEAKIIAKYETELRDSHTFDKWKEDMRKKDEEDAKKEAEDRLVENILRAKEAAALREVRDVQKVQDMKEEAQRNREHLEAERKAEEESNRGRRDTIVEARQGVKVAKELLDGAKRTNAAELVKEKEGNARRLAEEKALEMARKQNLIMQLKAIEAVPVSEVHKYDPTTTKGQGLLEEMSLAELKEKMVVVKRRQEEATIEKHNDILVAKQKKEADLMRKAANISRIRDMANVQAALRRRESVEEVAVSKVQHERKTEDEMLVLHARLEHKHLAIKQEQIRLQAEEKRIKFVQAAQAASAGAVEETKFREMRKGQERELYTKQAVVLADAQKHEAGKSRTETIRRGNLKAEKKGKRDFVKEYNEKLEQLNVANEQMLEEDLDRKRDMVMTETMRYTSMMERGLGVSSRTLKPPETEMERSIKLQERLQAQRMNA